MLRVLGGSVGFSSASVAKLGQLTPRRFKWRWNASPARPLVNSSAVTDTGQLPCRLPGTSWRPTGPGIASQFLLRTGPHGCFQALRKRCGFLTCGRHDQANANAQPAIEQCAAQLVMPKLGFVIAFRISAEHSAPQGRGIRPAGSSLVVHGLTLSVSLWKAVFARVGTQVPRQGSCPMMVNQRASNHAGPPNTRTRPGNSCQTLWSFPSSTTDRCRRRATGPGGKLGRPPSRKKEILPP